MTQPLEYLVLTECGRRFSWSALDLEHLYRQLGERSYHVKSVQLMSEYEAEIHRIEEQEKLTAEVTAAIEKGEEAAA